MEEIKPETSQIQLKACSKNDLVELYKVNWKILKAWIKPHEEEIGPRIGHFYTPKQMKIILEKLGFPEKIKND
jgi:hypothetical protein